MTLLVATGSEVLRAGAAAGAFARSEGLGPRPTCLATDRDDPRRAWCGTRDAGVFVTRDGGRSWRACGLAGERIMSVTASRARPGLLWVGTEPSRVWRSDDGGAGWRPSASLAGLPSAPEWSFPPRPETHHVRWIAAHPADAGTLWVAVEAGALLRTEDGGETWIDRVPGGPYDTHELALHAADPDHLRVAAGDGYFESRDGGASWRREVAGLDVGYLRSVCVDPGDPEVVVVSASSSARRAYGSGRSDGRLYRRRGSGSWVRVSEGWPERPRTIAPLLRAGRVEGELWAADERGVHRSEDGGSSWALLVPFEEPPSYLRGLAVLADGP